MLFTSLTYLPFLLAILILYWLVPAPRRLVLLLAASILFAAMLGIQCLVCAALCAGIAYLGGKWIEKCDNQIRKRCLAICFSFAMLVPMLFFRMMSGHLSAMPDWLTGVFSGGMTGQNVFLAPAGISFFTFTSLGYLLDVYHGRIKAETRPGVFLTFVLFFPHLTSGPIARGESLLGQMTEEKAFDFEGIRDGFSMILLGYFEKLWVADRIALYVNFIFEHWYESTGWQLLLAILLYTVQIYADFNGYSLIAIGSARCFGISLQDNFRQPYLAVSVRDFWKRWHISLTTWFRDEIYIPLGGSRKGNIRRYINILLVFLISGYWHGTGLTFLVWGGLHGLYQIAEILLDTESRGKNRYFCRIRTLVLVAFAWLFFRATSFQMAVQILLRIGTRFIGSPVSTGMLPTQWAAMVIGMLFMLLVDGFHEQGKRVLAFTDRKPWFIRGAVMMVFAFLLVIFSLWGSGYQSNSFIYFQF